MVLIGFMGAGKTSVGRALADRLGWIFQDLDDHIERREQRSVTDIFRDSGESEFRRAEHAAVKALMKEELVAEKVIAFGGGAFAQKRNAELIETNKVPTVFLDGDVAELWNRCQAQQHRSERPLLGTWESFRSLYETRRPHYLKASFRQETRGKTVDQIAAEIVRDLGLKSKTQ